jgi:hypothetical protein
MQTHYARMHSQARKQRRDRILADALIIAALLGLAGLTGWTLAAAEATCTALPQIVTQSQALAGW